MYAGVRYLDWEGKSEVTLYFGGSVVGSWTVDGQLDQADANKFVAQKLKDVFRLADSEIE